MKRVRFRVETFHGRAYRSNPYCHRAGVQIVAYDPDTMKRVYYFLIEGPYSNYKSPCFKLWEGCFHYQSGFNKSDCKQEQEALNSANEIADGYNKRQEERENAEKR